MSAPGNRKPFDGVKPTQTWQIHTFDSRGSSMGYRILAVSVVLLALVAGVSRSADATKQQEAGKKALQSFNDFIGEWKGDAESKTGKTEFWKEGMSWGWKFNKDGPPSIRVEFKDSKSFAKGEIKFVSDKKFQLIVTDKDKHDLVFEGEKKGKFYNFVRVDPASMDKFTIKLNTTNEGALMNLDYMVQAGGRGLDKKLFVLTSKKEGASISGAKKNECVVSGGVGTRAVSFNGKTYYVCCSGCAEAFAENPKKFVDEFEKKNKNK
jgi:hypothetical protein